MTFGNALGCVILDWKGLFVSGLADHRYLQEVSSVEGQLLLRQPCWHFSTETRERVNKNFVHARPLSATKFESLLDIEHENLGILVLLKHR